MVITWALLDTGQWDDALEYAGRARTLAAIYPEPVVPRLGDQRGSLHRRLPGT